MKFYTEESNKAYYYLDSSFRSEWLIDSGYYFMERKKAENVTGEVYTHKGIKWFLVKIKEATIAYEVETGRVLVKNVGQHKGISETNNDVVALIEQNGVIRIEAKISRIKHGQEGVRITPIELIIYGII